MRFAVASLVWLWSGATATAQTPDCAALPAADPADALRRASDAFHAGEFEASAEIAGAVLASVAAGCAVPEGEAASAARDLAAMLLWASDRLEAEAGAAGEAVAAAAIARLPDGQPDASAFPPSVLAQYAALRPAIPAGPGAAPPGPGPSGDGEQASRGTVPEPGPSGDVAPSWTPLVASTLMFAGAAIAAGGAVAIDGATDRRALADRAAMPADRDRLVAEADDREIAGWTLVGIGIAAAAGAAAWWIADAILRPEVDDTPMPVEALPIVSPGGVGIVVGFPLEVF